MKILTLNTHSLAEPGYEEKIVQFADAAAAWQPDVMGFQEVNQTASAPVLPEERLKGYVRCSGFAGCIREDNHGARLAGLLEKRGLPYFWTWLPAKLGYGKYDEGLAVFSRSPLLETEGFTISCADDYNNWKTRKILGIRREEGWFYSVHMGWWEDQEEPFSCQWDRVDRRLKGKAAEMAAEAEENAAGAADGKAKSGNIWVMGDFNSPAQIRDQGYDYVRRLGWKDTYSMAETRDNGITVDQVIDGWRDKLVRREPEERDDPEKKEELQGMRIDFIWSLRELPVIRSRVVFNGKEYPKVSDHNGVMIETGRSRK